MNSLLLWIGGLLVAVLGLMFAVPHVVDWNAYRGVFEEEASRILGREVRVGGQVNLRLLPSPYVRFEKVRISDAGAALGEPFFRAEAFTLWLAPTPLLKGAIEASELELDRPVLRLAVDAEGRGNWQAFKITPGAVPFMPSNVVLQQVRIREGIVSLKTPGAVEPQTLAGINGEVAAASLDGPYRFNGLVDWYGSRRQLRIGTSQREVDGKLRYKATVRVPESGNNYAIDGALSELTAKARHTGTLTAKLPLTSVFAGISDSRARGQGGADTVDFQATLEGDLDGAKLSNMAFAFELDGKPQLVNGELVASWRQGMRIETRLASRWLDLDQIVGPELKPDGKPEGKKAAPAETVRRLISHVGSMLPGDGTSLLTIDVDQLNLGGDALSGVRLALARAGGLTSIGELRAALPGNARGELRGTLTARQAIAGAAPAPAQAPADAFDGELVLSGASYQRFAAWAGAELLLPPVTADKNASNAVGAPFSADAPFSVDARVRLLPDSIALTDAKIELGVRFVKGSADWRWGNQPGLDIVAEGPSIDIGAFAPGALDLVGGESRDKESAAGRSRFADTGSLGLARLADRVAAIERAVGSMRLRLRTNELTDGRATLRDVDADLTVKDNALTLAGLRLTGRSGARFDVQGELGSLRSKPAGSLRGWIAADGPDAIGTALDLLPTGARVLAGRWLSQTAKANLGFTLTLRGAGTDQVSLSANGLLDTARTTLKLELDGGLAQWREAPIALALDLDGASAASVLRRMNGRDSTNAAAGAPLDGVKLQVRAAGANATSILTTARLEAGSGVTRTTAEYKGRSTITADGGMDLVGEASLNAPAAADLFLLTGVPRRLQLAGTAVRGQFEIERTAGTTTLSARGMQVGASRVAGKLTLAAKGERTRLDGQLTADRLPLAGLMGLVLDGQAAPVRGDDTEPSTRGENAPWPDAPFSMALLDGMEGQIVIRAPTAGLSPDLEITDAEARLAFTPGRLEIQAIAGAALGGRFTARGVIEGTPGGAGVTLDARLTGGQLAALTGNQSSAAGNSGDRGEANVSVAITSRGISPRAAMSTASGKGEIEIRNGRIQGIAAALVEKSALAVIDNGEQVDRSALERIVGAERSRSTTVIGNRKLPIEIADGAAKIGALEITAPEANLRNLTTIDLAQLKADSEWQIAPRRPLPGTGRATSARREPLPPMTLVWTGPLGAIGRAEPRVSIDQLERELAIRKMERDAERLEELRLDDEERARAEAERRKQLEAPGPATPAVAPVIEAPLPINPRNLPGQSSSPPPGGTGADGEAGAPAPLPRVIRPPPGAPRPARDSRTLQDILSGQQ